jgi:hypothetical protein
MVAVGILKGWGDPRSSLAGVAMVAEALVGDAAAGQCWKAEDVAVCEPEPAPGDDVDGGDGAA